VLGLLAVAVVTGLVACGNGSSGGGGSGTTNDFSFLNGSWVIDQTLEGIDNEERRPLADIPSARWECSVDGDAMTIQTLNFTYAGQITAEGDGWAYEGSASFEDDKGESWTATLEVHATMEGEDTFGGTMERSIDSDVRGHDYAATWGIIGKRE